MDQSLDSFLHTADFGEQVTVKTSPSSAPKICNAVFTAPGQIMDINGVRVINQHPTFLLKTVDIVDADTQTTITGGDGLVYYVRQNLADGTGMSTVVAGTDQ